MRQKGPAGDGNQRFGYFFRDGAQPRGEPTGEDGDGNVQRRSHEINELGPLKIKPEADFPEPGLPHRVTQPALVLRVKHEKTAAARADEFAAEGAVGHGQVIPLVDFRIAHAAAALFFALPVHVHQAAQTRAGRRLPARAGFADQGP